MTALAAEHLSKNFLGVQALKDLSVEFGEGICTGLVGPNGSGKSTFLQLACGLIPPSSGAVILSGRHLTRVKPYRIRKYGITRTFQDGRLIGQMSVLDNLLLASGARRPFAALCEFWRKDRLKREEAILKRIGLWEKRHAQAGQLSYGQRKLLEIARALTTRADTYLLDEPFSGLFPDMIEMVAGLIMDMKAKGRTIILIEHNMNLVSRLCDHLVVLDAGKFLCEGPPEKVLNDPAVLEAYLGE
jgi:ABC-type branched-subunit amino acid transport system ATPase component